MSDSSDALDSVQRRVRELLAVLENPNANGAAIEAALEESRLSVEVLRGLLDQGAPSAPEERERLQDGLERALRLNTVAMGLAESQARELVLELERAQGARRALDRRPVEDDAGRSCDIAG